MEFQIWIKANKEDIKTWELSYFDAWIDSLSDEDYKFLRQNYLDILEFMRERAGNEYPAYPELYLSLPKDRR